MPKNENNGAVALFFTGGTICMTPLSEHRGVVPSGEFKRLIAELTPHVGEVGLKPVLWSDLPSPHMTPDHMFRLAMDVKKTLADPGILGAVVVHGTDVLVESAFMADLYVDSPKPVVFTGSMRFYSESGYDGIRNLINAVKACVLPLPQATGVVILMADRFFRVREAAKVNSLNVDAFEAPEAGPVGYVAGEMVLLTRTPARLAGPDRKFFEPAGLEPATPLITCYTGMGGELIDQVRKAGAKGLVLQGFGAGNIPPGAVGALMRLVEEGKPVVLTTQCLEGGVWPIYAYPGGGDDLKQKGVILGGRLSGAKARLQLMAALGAGRTLSEIKKIFASE
jgi:L-asparaginase